MWRFLMGRSTVRRFLRAHSSYLLVIPVAILVFQNCGVEQKFEGTSTTSKSANESAGGPGAPGAGGALKSVDIKVTATSQQLAVDIVWVIDNSGSMDAEAANVRRNVQGFADKVRLKANLRMGLISNRGNSGTAVQLPNDPDFLQIDHTVGSYNSLLLAASAICPVANPSAGCRAIGSTASFSPVGSSNPMREILDSQGVRGTLRNLLSRKEAKKIFVFVTDDNSSLNAVHFLDVAKENLEGQTPVVFNFATLSQAQSPCGVNVSGQYLQLASQTGGANYNVCDVDWSATFDKLVNDVGSVIDRAITLPAELTQVKLVSVLKGGKALDSNLYEYVGGVLRISQQVILVEGETLQVMYQE